MDKSVDDQPASAAAAGGDAYVRPAQPTKKKRKKSDKKIELDDLKRELEMVSKVFTRFP